MLGGELAVLQASKFDGLSLDPFALSGEIVTRTMLLENVWSFHFDPGTNLIESHMSRLRAKVDRGFDREIIHTVRNAGYCLDAEV